MTETSNSNVPLDPGSLCGLVNVFCSQEERENQKVRWSKPRGSKQDAWAPLYDNKHAGWREQDLVINQWIFWGEYKDHVWLVSTERASDRRVRTTTEKPLQGERASPGAATSLPHTRGRRVKKNKTHSWQQRLRISPPPPCCCRTTLRTQSQSGRKGQRAPPGSGWAVLQSPGPPRRETGWRPARNKAIVWVMDRSGVEEGRERESMWHKRRSSHSRNSPSIYYFF